jgi:hypothetical protein
VLAAAAGAAVAVAQEGSLRFEKTVGFNRGQLISLGARVGPVRVANVRLEVESPDAGGGGIRSRLPRMPGSGDPEVQQTIKASFDCENPDDEEWVVTYTLDFLDSNGRLIDRASDKEGFEGEAKTYTLSHNTLRYVVPAIARVRIKLEAKYD